MDTYGKRNVKRHWTLSTRENVVPSVEAMIENTVDTKIETIITTTLLESSK